MNNTFSRHWERSAYL